MKNGNGIDLEKDILVTIITPTYYSKNVKDTVDSILGQDYDKIQFIMTDDGTDPFDVAEVEEYIKTNARGNIVEFLVFHSNVNQGTVKNVNIGLRHARGDVIILLAGDDQFSDESVVSDWVDFLRKTEYLYATSYREIIDEVSGEFVEILPTDEQVSIIKQSKPTELFEEIAKQNFIIGCTTVFTRAFWDKYLCFDERYKLIDDYPNLLRALREDNDIGFFERKTIRYYCGGVSSPKNYSAVYKRDSHNIFKYEIKPFSKNPIRSRIALWWWESKQKNESDFIKGYEYSKTHKYFMIILGIKHPIRAVKKIKRDLKRRV